MTKEHPKTGKFGEAEKLVTEGKTLEELYVSLELMLEHLHRFQANPQFPENSPVIRGFKLVVAALEARIRLKEFLISEMSPK